MHGALNFRALGNVQNCKWFQEERRATYMQKHFYVSISGKLPKEILKERDLKLQGSRNLLWFPFLFYINITFHTKFCICNLVLFYLKKTTNIVKFWSHKTWIIFLLTLCSFVLFCFVLQIRNYSIILQIEICRMWSTRGRAVCKTRVRLPQSNWSFQDLLQVDFFFLRQEKIADILLILKYLLIIWYDGNLPNQKVPP